MANSQNRTKGSAPPPAAPIVAPVAQAHEGGEGKIAAGRVAAEHDALRIDLPAPGMCREPQHQCLDPVKRLRVFCFRRERIVDADDSHLGLRRIFSHQPVVGIVAEQGEAATMNVDHGRQKRAGPHRPVNADAEVAGAEIEGEILSDRHVRPAPAPPFADSFCRDALVWEGHRLERWPGLPVFAHLHDEPAKVRVELVQVHFGLASLLFWPQV